MKLNGGLVMTGCLTIFAVACGGGEGEEQTREVPGVLGVLKANGSTLQDAVLYGDGGNTTFETCADCVDNSQMSFDFTKNPIEWTYKTTIVQAGVDYDGNEIYSDGQVGCVVTGIVTETEAVTGFDEDVRQIIRISAPDIGALCPSLMIEDWALVVDLSEGWYYDMEAFTTIPATTSTKWTWDSNGGFAYPAFQCDPSDADANGMCDVSCSTTYNFDIAFWNTPTGENCPYAE